jgi:hypothetical protein
MLNVNQLFNYRINHSATGKKKAAALILMQLLFYNKKDKNYSYLLISKIKLIKAVRSAILITLSPFTSALS